MGDPIPVTLGRYVILEEIGRGMMGAVYRAADPDLGRVVALKTVQLAFAVSEREREQFEQRFMAEARAAGGLSHPGIVIVHDVGRDTEAGELFIALEFLEGRTFEQLVTEKPLEWAEALRLTARVAEALEHAHERGIVHRDIKPANIMLLANGEPKIMDFGIAKLSAAQITLAGQFFGTPAYMSPEQAAGAETDGRSDIFSLGAILYFLLTGQRAFTGSSVPAIVASVQAREPAPPSSLLPGIPASVDYIVARALAKDPAERYARGRMLAEDAEDVRAGRAPRHRADWMPRSASSAVGRAAGGSPQPGPRRGRTIPIAATVLALGALAVWVGSGRRPMERGPAEAARMPRATAEVERAASAPSPEPTAQRAPVQESRHAPAARPRVPRVTPRAGLQIAMAHSLRQGQVRVWIDDDLVLDTALSRRAGPGLLPFGLRGGGYSRTLAVAPGTHVVRLAVSSGADSWTESITGEFTGGAARRLNASLRGVPRRRLSLRWTVRARS